MALMAISRMTQNQDVKNEFGQYVDSLFSACEQGNSEELESLLKKREEFNTSLELALVTRSYTGDFKPYVIKGAVYMLYIRLIDAAVLSGNQSIVQVILKHRLNAKLDMTQNLSPFHWLCLSRGKREELKSMTSLLCRSGYDINTTARRGYSALHVACKFMKNVDAVKVLIDAGSDVNKQTQFGLTPLHICCSSSNFLKKRSHEVMIEWLLQSGADLSLRCKLKRTAADIVGSSNERTHILKNFLSYGLSKDMLSKGVPAYKLQRQLLRRPESWDIIIPLIEIGYKFKLRHIIELPNEEPISKNLDKSCYEAATLNRINELQSCALSLQRLCCNVVTVTLQPRGFYPSLLQMDMLPKSIKDYIQFKHMTYT